MQTTKQMSDFFGMVYDSGLNNEETEHPSCSTNLTWGQWSFYLEMFWNDHMNRRIESADYDLFKSWLTAETSWHEKSSVASVNGEEERFLTEQGRFSNVTDFGGG